MNIDKTSTVRLDKWLWAARFFKTRSLASQAISNGKIYVHGERPKPSRKVQIDDELTIRQGCDEKTVIVTDLSEKRGSATMAAELYAETEKSINKRKTEAEKRKIMNTAIPESQHRPNKKQRRQIHRFKNIND